MRDDLGEWIKWRLRRGVQEQGRAAQDQIEDCGVPTEELGAQWASQKESQLSIRARTLRLYLRLYATYHHGYQMHRHTSKRNSMLF